MTSKLPNEPLAEIRLAMMTLTRLPVGRISEPVPPMARTRWAYPLVGLVLGAVIGGVFVVLTTMGIAPLVAAFVAILAGVLATGALHEDGLADCVDGFWGGSTRQRKLDIMRDSRIGTYGTLALIFSVGLRGAALASLVAPFWTVIAVAMLSRYAMVVAIDLMPSARIEGLGAAVADEHGRSGRAALLGFAGAIVLVTASGSGGLIAIATMSIAGLAFARLAMRQIGGQTGDVLGGVQQVTEIAALVALSVLAT